MPVKERLIEYVKYRGISNSEFCRTIGVSNAFISSMVKSIQPDKIKSITLSFPDLNTGWLLTGEGEMLKSDMVGISNIWKAMVPLLPLSAQGGPLNDFTMGVQMRDCEKIISPITGIDFAIRISGDSMAPEYPSGGTILVKKINHKSFIEWGRCYVLDTTNGVVVKKITAPDTPDQNYGMNYVYCVSINPNPIYQPFRVPVDGIFGMYRVKMLLDEK